MNQSIFDLCVRRGEAFFRKHGNAILTVAELAALGFTANSLMKETIKAKDVLQKHQTESLAIKEDRHESRKGYLKEKMVHEFKGVKEILPYFKWSIIGFATTAALSLTRLYTTNKALNDSALAYLALSNRFKSYRETVSNQVKEKQLEEIEKDYILNDQKLASPVTGKEPYYDTIGERTVYLSENDILRAELFINQYLMINGELNLNTLYSEIGLDLIPDGDIIGWSMSSLYEEGYCDYAIGPWVHMDIVERGQPEENGPKCKMLVPSALPSTESLLYDYIDYDKQGIANVELEYTEFKDSPKDIDRINQRLFSGE